MSEVIESVEGKKQEEIITITLKAIQELKRILAENKVPNSHVVRIGVKGGGCSGFTYALAVDENGIREKDKVFEFEGLKVVVDPKSPFYISGTELDFSDGLNGKGFVFNNPNATKTCGCGSSFSA